MSPSIPIHAQFMDWIADLEQSAKGPWGNVSKSPAIYNNGIRVMFFSDTNCFDSKQKQIAVCIDGNVNIALEEMFDSESCTMTLEELQDFRLIITGKIRNEHMFISKDNTTVRIADTASNVDVYRQVHL